MLMDLVLDVLLKLMDKFKIIYVVFIGYFMGV